MMRLVMELGKYLIRYILLFSIVISLTLFGLDGIIEKISGFVLLVATGSYTISVWSRIPLANNNFNVALACIKKNFGMVYIATFFALYHFFLYCDLVICVTLCN